MSRSLIAYSVAVAASIIVLLLRYLLIPWFGADTPLLIVIIAPIVASLYGTKPALLATALCLAGTAWLLLEPLYSFQLQGLEALLRLVLIGLVGISISIIGGYRLKNKEALEASMERQEIAVDAADLGVFEWDLLNDVVLWENNRMYEIFGHSKAEGTVNFKQFIENYVHKEDLVQFEDFVQRAQEAGGRLNITCRISRKSDQQIRLLELGGRFQYGPDNEPTKLIGVARDITEQKKMENEIDRTRHRLQSILDTVPACIYQMDINGNFEFVNTFWEKLVGYEISKVTGRNVMDIFPRKDAEIFLENNKIVLSDSEVKEFEEKLTIEDGMHIYSSIKTPIFDEEGRPLGVLGISTDITERIRMENELRVSDARKDEFLAVLGHELRNPLSPLCAGIELLAQVRSKPEMLEDIQAMMARQVAHLKRLVDDLLNMSRISRGLIELRRCSLDINSIIPEALEQVGPVYKKRHIKIITKCSDEALLVDGDLDRLTQVVVNLLNNAAKFMNDPGTVTISTYAEDEHAVLKVSDTGYGISAEYLKSIFEMFTQVSEHKNFTGGGGLGIGLALSKKLIELHGGSIAVSSEGPGRGSEFAIRIPLLHA